MCRSNLTSSYLTKGLLEVASLLNLDFHALIPRVLDSVFLEGGLGSLGSIL